MAFLSLCRSHPDSPLIPFAGAYSGAAGPSSGCSVIVDPRLPAAGHAATRPCASSSAPSSFDSTRLDFQILSRNRRSATVSTPCKLKTRCIETILIVAPLLLFSTKETCNWEVPRRRALWIWGRGARCWGPSEAWRSSSRICSRPTLEWGIGGGWSRGQRRPGSPISWPGNWGKGQWSWKDSSPFRRGSLCSRSSFARSGSPLESLATAPSDFSSLPGGEKKENHRFSWRWRIYFDAR